MIVRLVDIDSKMPNLALMKISAYHKAQGHGVDYYNPLIDVPDLIYASKIFDFSADYAYFPDHCEVIKGGSGYDIKSRLPQEIEQSTKLDYSLYPNADYSIQFFSRGCIRKCPFCIVKDKEGAMHAVEPMELNPKGKHVEIFDNNFFANPDWKEAIKIIQSYKQPVNFHGVDLRLINEEQAYYLNKIKHHKQIHVAWDNPKDDLLPKLKEMVKYIKPYKIMCYVLIGYWSTHEQNLYRVEKLRELKIDPFVMPYDKSDEYQRNFARWVNHKAVFKTVSWQDYKKTRG